ncbi:MAG: hydrogenase iron-sulfur subunit [Anaerolineae bacterium]
MNAEPKFVIFTCNWNAHESLQEAGKRHLHYPTGARPLKVDCLGQVSASTVLKALEKGADGVMLIGCIPEECHYEFGSRRAAELFEEVRDLARLLGFREEQLAFHQIGAGEGEALIEKVQQFAARLAASGPEAGAETKAGPSSGEGSAR